jgi:hypothetical protein
MHGLCGTLFQEVGSFKSLLFCCLTLLPLGGIASALCDVIGLTEALSPALTPSMQDKDQILRQCQYFQWKRNFMQLNANLTSVTMFDLLAVQKEGSLRAKVRDYA